MSQRYVVAGLAAVLLPSCATGQLVEQTIHVDPDGTFVRAVLDEALEAARQVPPSTTVSWDEKAAEEAVIIAAARSMNPLNSSDPFGPPTVAEQQTYLSMGGMAGTMSGFCSGLVVGIVATLGAYVTRTGVASEGDAPEESTEMASTEDPPALADGADKSQVAEIKHKSATEDVESLHLFWPRITMLVVLMLLDSGATFILDCFRHLETVQPALLLFLGMTVGTAGNVGAQSVVMAVRSLCLGEEVALWKELRTGLKLGLALGFMALIRCTLQGGGVQGSLIIGTSVGLVVIAAAFLGTLMPVVFFKIKFDPAHATAGIQVCMDITGSLITCLTGCLFLWIWAKFAIQST